MNSTRQPWMPTLEDYLEMSFSSWSSRTVILGAMSPLLVGLLFPAVSLRSLFIRKRDDQVERFYVLSSGSYRPSVLCSMVHLQIKREEGRPAVNFCMVCHNCILHGYLLIRSSHRWPRILVKYCALDIHRYTSSKSS